MNYIQSRAVPHEYHVCGVAIKKECPTFKPDDIRGADKCEHEGGIWVSNGCSYPEKQKPPRYCKEGYKICVPEALRCKVCYLIK